MESRHFATCNNLTFLEGTGGVLVTRRRAHHSRSASRGCLERRHSCHVPDYKQEEQQEEQERHVRVWRQLCVIPESCLFVCTPPAPPPPPPRLKTDRGINVGPDLTYTVGLRDRTQDGGKAGG